MRRMSKLGMAFIVCLLLAEWPEVDRAVGYENWQLIGPGGGGQITCITEDPSSPDNLYITINTGGARKSTDGGRTWLIINRGFDYTTHGKGGHRMMEIAVHPSHSHVLLAAGLKGDIYESTNGGQEWQLSYRHPGAESERDVYHFSRFVFDPGNRDVVYIGVGSIQKLLLGVEARRTGEHWPKIDVGPTILRGEWNGSTWDWKDVGSIEGNARGCDEYGCGRYLNIYSIGVCPDDTRRLLFVTERGVYKGEIDSYGRIESFTRIRKGLPKSKYIHGGKIVFDSHNPGIAYLTLCNIKNKKIELPEGGEEAVGGVFKSVDNGESWSKLRSGLDDNSNYFDIQIDPNNPEIIYVAQFHKKIKGTWVTGNLYRSGDSGDTWRDLVQKTTSNVDAGWQQPDVRRKKRFGVHFIGVSKRNVVLWNKGGILCESDDLSPRYPEWHTILTEKVGKGEWSTTGCEAIALAHSIGIDPKDSNILYLPYGDHDYFKSANGGDSLKILVTNKEIKEAGNTYDSGTLLVDGINSKKLYVATQGPHQKLEDGGIMYSRDRGKHWATIGWHLKDYLREDRLKRGAKADMLIEYVGQKRNLYVANYGNISSRDESQGGVYLLEGFDGIIDGDAIDYWNANWKKIFPAEEGQYMKGTHVLAARDDFNTLYVGVNKEVDNEYGFYKLRRTADGWENEGRLVSDDPDFNQSNSFNDVETGPESDYIYIATDKGVFVLDENDTITEVRVPQFEELRSNDIDPEVEAIEIHSYMENIMYVASPKTEILRSSDRGLTWTEISEDIPTLGFIVLKVDPNQDVIYAESPAAGIWKRSFVSH